MNNQDIPDIKVTITHHDVQLPQYDIKALKDSIEHSKKHVQMLQAEINNQLTQQKELKRLIRQQTAQTTQTPGG